MLGWSLSAAPTPGLTYSRRASHLIFLPFASALQATTACFRATFSALVILADSAVNVAPIVKATAIMHVVRPVTKPDIGNFLDLILVENSWFWTGARNALCHPPTQTV